MKYKINDITKLVGLCRSTLLHYEKKGLVVPQKDCNNNYRVYSESDLENLKKIHMYRDMGISLNDIKKIIFKNRTDIKALLEEQLKKINLQISNLRLQQNRIFDIIKIDNNTLNSRFMNKNTWIKILKGSGLDEKGMREWHRCFEKTAPEAHQDFLENLGITPKEIEEIRKWSSR
ncbi:MerR family transcriptional regulator [Lentisphaerota bacterium ZTH]|nr:MerR family transcriptional regulator [Lentisphaerota bacterium]WET05728.1 MerR family transcriptional regulator [Lentisphaerota bacterium ZTH]